MNTEARNEVNVDCTDDSAAMPLSDLDDVRVRALADAITEAQKREIAEMNWLLDDIDANGKATTEAEAAERPMPELTVSDHDG